MIAVCESSQISKLVGGIVVENNASLLRYFGITRQPKKLIWKSRPIRAGRDFTDL